MGFKMTDILPPAGWPNVRQLETNEFALGGANGNMNEQAKSLAARSELLKQYAALPYESKTGGYALNERVQIATGDIVRSTIASNVNNPNENMTGWVLVNSDSQIKTWSGRTQESKNKDIIDVRDFNPVLDGVADNTQVVKDVKQYIDRDGKGVLTIPSNLKSSLTNGQGWGNNLSNTTMAFSRPSVQGLFDGSNDTPEVLDANPAHYVQKHLKMGFDYDVIHKVGSGFYDFVIHGSDDVNNPNRGTWISLLGNATSRGKHESGKSDLSNTIVGVAGFANSEVCNNGLTVGLWGYAVGPYMTTAERDATVDQNWGMVGTEINVYSRCGDIGYRSAPLTGKGHTVGILVNTFIESALQSASLQFGVALRAEPQDRNYENHDINNWNGYHVGYFVDGVKKYGIAFGNHWADDSVGIQFPTSYLGTTRPINAIHLGNNTLNLGNYTGTKWNNGDVWMNGGNIFVRYGDTNYQIFNKNINISSTDIRKADANSTLNLGSNGFKFDKSYVVQRHYTATVFDSAGTGSPEGVVAASVGSTYRRTDGGSGSTFYVKEAGTGNTGWVAK